jgi:hypothetical protein
VSNLASKGMGIGDCDCDPTLFIGAVIMFGHFVGVLSMG